MKLPTSRPASTDTAAKTFAFGFARTWENLLLAGILSAAMVIRVIDIFTRHFNSDEPQHLHIIWGWAHGYVQYRDIFDNHAPLFHILLAPLFALLPEWSGAIYAMRAAMLPFYLLTLWCTYLIGRTLFSHRTGLWAMAFLALYGRFFLKMLEFRADVLWTALLTLGIYLVVRRPGNVKSSFLTGLVFGAALAVSFKTIILLAVLTISLPLAWAMSDSYSMPIMKQRLVNGCYAIAGFLVIPIVVIIFFYCLHALPQLYYGVIQHNVMAHSKSAFDYGRRVIHFPLWMAGAYGFAWLIRSKTQDADKRLKRIFIMATGITYLAIVYSYWPIVTQQTLLPAFPVIVLSFTPFLTGEYSLLQGIVRPFKRREGTKAASPISLLAVIALMQLFMLIRTSGMVGSHLHQNPQMWKDVLKFTDPGDYVMDAKGESIFRMRPYFYGFETITEQLVGSGAIKDNSADSLITKPTYVVVAENFCRYPSKLQTFVDDNYIRAGALFVAGKKLAYSPNTPNSPISFSIAIPGRYIIVSEKGQAVPGILNGKCGAGVFNLKAGSQQFIPTGKATSLTVVWDKAWERGIHLPLTS